jgi:predicted nucleotidyltransferase
MEKIESILNGVVDKIVGSFSPEKVIIFGSHAYGKPTEKSDIDILVIMETDKRDIERIIEISKLIQEYHKKIDFDILVKTPEEIRYRLEIDDPFIKEILSKGMVRYAR